MSTGTFLVGIGGLCIGLSNSRSPAIFWVGVALIVFGFNVP